MDQDQLPSSLGEVESLVRQLYRPEAPEQVAKTQETLQRLQRSPEGWRMASSLLGNKDEQVRFFGALTFIVKLNTDGRSLEDADAQALLQTLIGFLVQSLANGEGPLVVRKLCSALVAYFMQFSSSWAECIKHLMFCLCLDRAVPHEGLGEAPDTAVMVASLSDEKAVAMLWFASTLVEEVGKTDSNSMKQNQFHRLMVPNVQCIVPLLSRYISASTGSASMKVRLESVKCLQSWVSYSQRAFIDDHIVLHPLNTLTQPTIMCIVDDDLYEPAIELISDVLTNYSNFLKKDDFTILMDLFSSPWAQRRFEQLLQGDYDFDSLQFGMFVVAFGDANMDDLTKQIGNDSKYDQFLTALCTLLGAEGYAVHEDKIFVPTLEFWSAYVETVLDCSYVEPATPSWLLATQQHIFQAVGKCLRKIQFPPASIFNSWDSVDRTGFKDARRDFSDMMQQFYIVRGITTYQYFIDYANKAITSRNWAELEVAWYIMGWFSDSAYGNEQRDEYLLKVFDASVLALFLNPEQVIPTRAKKTFLELVSSYSDFFEANPTNLAAVLNIVFEATSNRALATVASASISKLCSGCRHTLLPELGAFIQQYSNITTTSSLDGSVKEGVIQGIAALIQAIPTNDMKIEPLDQLLNFVETDVERSLQLASVESSTGSDIDNAQSGDSTAAAVGLAALKCLEGMAKGSQAPDDVPFDLEKPDTGAQFWLSGNGARIQHRIFSMLSRIFDVFGNRGDFVETSCLILRRGFRELEPGPFVLPPELVAQLFLKADLNTPRLGFVLSTASNLMNDQKWGIQINSVLESLLGWVSHLLQGIAEPRNDPEIAQRGVEFMARLLPKHLHVFLGYQPPAALEYMFMFTLKALTGSDPLPKNAAAEFWSSFIGLCNMEQQLQTTVDNALQHLGPILVQAIIYNIGGNAARSELDKLVEPIKKLVVRRKESKGWFEAALNAENFPSDKVTSADKAVFLQKIISLRGQRATHQVVREFWLACRGSNYMYAS